MGAIYIGPGSGQGQLPLGSISLRDIHRLVPGRPVTDDLGASGLGLKCRSERFEAIGDSLGTLTAGTDLLDGTPVLDIKPWFADCDLPPDT